MQPSTDWFVAGVGDFGGYYNDDILWRNPNTGAVAVWVTDLLAPDVCMREPLRRVDPSWVIASVGDFDGDGHADVLWRQPLTGANAIWPNANPGAAERLASARPVWQVGDVLDLNGDSRADIIWRNPTTGANVVWYSGDGATAVPLTGVTNPAWHIVP